MDRSFPASRSSNSWGLLFSLQVKNLTKVSFNQGAESALLVGNKAILAGNIRDGWLKNKGFS